MLSPSRLRVLRMLDQQGPLHRHAIGEAFSRPDRRRGMSPQAATRLAGYICKPLLEQGLIVERNSRAGYHVHMSITAAGKAALRQ